MPPKKQSQSTLNLPKNRRNTRQQQQKLKSVHDESIIQIGTHQVPQQTSSKPESKSSVHDIPQMINSYIMNPKNMNLKL